jgi:outer membrane protease
MLHRAAAISAFAFAVLGAAPPLRAQTLEANSPPPSVVQHGNVAIEASIGVMQGEANELVYRSDGSKVSQLVWAFDNELVFKGGLAARPWRWLAVGGRFVTNITDGSTMDDYDWIPETDPNGCPDGFCHSHHPDTTLQSYLSIDAYLAATFYENHWMALTALAGYKRDSQSWRALDGPSNYTSFVPGRLAISYDQVWDAPYLGVQFNGEWNRWTLQGRVIGS